MVLLTVNDLTHTTVIENPERLEEVFTVVDSPIDTVIVDAEYSPWEGGFHPLLTKMTLVVYTGNNEETHAAVNAFNYRNSRLLND